MCACARGCVCQCGEDREVEEVEEEAESSWLSDILWLGKLLNFLSTCESFSVLMVIISKFAKLLNHCEWGCIIHGSIIFHCETLISLSDLYTTPGNLMES